MPRTLITGGAGFLGSHLCEYFLNKGHEVICMDNLITGSKDNISQIKNEKFQFVGIVRKQTLLQMGHQV